MSEVYRTFVFYDGNNFYHNLKITISKSINPALSCIKPSDIDLYKLSEGICSHFNVNHIKSFYYNSVPNIDDNPDIYYSHMKYLSWVSSLPKFAVITRKLQSKSTKEILQEKMDILKRLKLCNSCKPVVEKNCLDCIGPLERKEKGIDVMIATDMLYHSIKNNCDCCVLVSGDADFIPVFNLIKLVNKKIFSASLYYGYSSEIRRKYRPFLVLGDDFLLKCLKKD